MGKVGKGFVSKVSVSFCLMLTYQLYRRQANRYMLSLRNVFIGIGGCWKYGGVSSPGKVGFKIRVTLVLESGRGRGAAIFSTGEDNISW